MSALATGLCAGLVVGVPFGPVEWARGGNRNPFDLALVPDARLQLEAQTEHGRPVVVVDESRGHAVHDA